MYKKILITVLVVLGVLLGTGIACADSLQGYFNSHGLGDINVSRDELGIERFPAGYYKMTILNGVHTYNNPTGWYVTRNERYLLFPGRPPVGLTKTFEAHTDFGFYINSNAGRFFTERALNGDSVDHALVFAHPHKPGYVVAFEDLYGGGDRDYTDRVFTVEELFVPVSVDIKPQSCPNPVNVKSRGVISAAVLGTESFDPASVDPDSVTLAGVPPLRASLEDVATPFGQEISDAYDCVDLGPDGMVDLVLKFDRQEVVEAIESELGMLDDGDEIILPLTGDLNQGSQIRGEDMVLILKKGKK